MNDSSNSRPQSSELTAGTGFTYEDVVSGVYLASLLAESSAPGLEANVVTKVAFQQAAFGEPLDDLIIDGQANDNSVTRLSLQIKRSLKIGAGKSNTDFRGVITASWDTLNKPDFREGHDRYGCVVDTISANRLRTLQTICEWARASADPAHFDDRFSTGGPAGAGHRDIKTSIEAILTEHIGADVEASQLYQFLRHFLAIQMDALHEGETTSASVVSQLGGALADTERNRGQDLWDALQRLASENRGRSAALERVDLLAALKGRFRLRGSPALEKDIALIKSIATDWPKSIEDTISGVAVPRPALRSALDEAAKKHRFVQVHGLPGTGKTAALKQLAQDCLANGPILFLMPDRLIGNSWQAFSQSIGLSCQDPETLLAEIGALGTPYLFIDGIDRIEPKQRNIVTDLLHAVLDSEALNDWRIVVTARDVGIEPLRNWLPARLFAMQGVGMVEVEPFSDEEARALAIGVPALRQPLFSNQQVQSIARRPFFASVLAREIAFGERESEYAPRSEIDLAERWWRRGGYDAVDTDARKRQRAIIDLARAACQRLGRAFSLSKLSESTIGELQGLIADGIVDEVDAGHRVKFSHDIFFEWSFLQLLKDEDDWIGVIADVGEPPVLGRVVELLSQSEFAKEDDWRAQLARIEASNLRSQWARAWLLGPLGAADFKDHLVVFNQAVDAEEYRLLRKVLVWFQAERTRPNDYILSHNAASSKLRRSEIIRYADALGWPSNIAMWQQMLVWLFARLDGLPKSLVPHIVPVFEVWQNAFQAYSNPISERIVLQCLAWLDSIEEVEYPKRFSMDLGEWEEVGRRDALASLASSLRSVVVVAADPYPEPIKQYLQKVAAQERINREVYKELVGFSPKLAQTHPEELVAFTEVQLLKELPEDTEKRLRREAIEHRQWLEQIRAKSESDRTRQEEMALSHSSPFISHGVSHWDWERLSVSDELNLYFPSSPLREPFHSLFQHNAEIALRLVRNLCNHAITAWRQLHRLDYQRRGTPIPLRLELPWGTQTMWGGTRVYLWGRGWWGPHAVRSALQALDAWAFDQLEGGAEPDDIIRRLLKGHESVAPLSIAVCIALEAKRTSEVTLPLATSQRLWHADIQRSVNEHSNSRSNLIGFNAVRTDRAHVDAITKSSERPCRQMELRQLAQLFVLNHDKSVRERAQSAIQRFPDDLPFEYEEHRADDAHVRELLNTASNWAEWGKLENYRSQPVPEQPGQRLIYLENPKNEAPEVQQVAARHQQNIREIALFNWVTDTFDKGALSDRMAVEEAIKLAQSIDHAQLFAEQDNIEISSMTRGAVAGTAAAFFCFPDKVDPSFRQWAAELMDRAYGTPEPAKDWFAGAIIPWHPLLFVAKGLLGKLRRSPDDQDAIRKLLNLAAHPLDQVSLEAIKQCLACWEFDKRLAWIGFDLGLRLCVREQPPRGHIGRSFDPGDELAKREDVAGAAIDRFFRDTGFSDLVAPPPAWELGPARRLNWFADEDADSNGGRQDDQTDLAWQDSRIYWDWGAAKDVLQLAPIDRIMRDAELRPKFLLLIDNLLDWTLERMNPSWREDDIDHRERRHTDLLEWIGQLSTTLAYVSVHLTADEAANRYLKRIHALDDEQSMSFLSGFVDIFICLTVLDAEHVTADALAILDHSLDRVLQDKTFQRRSYREGEVYGFDLPRLISSFLFIQVPKADMAARFANGNWSDIEVVMPLIDKFVSSAGWVPKVARDFLTLAENAADQYPANRFADQIITIFEQENLTRAGWTSTVLLARIAVMVQSLADRDQPLDVQLAQKLLRILDFLVDMGDRRSAALQLSETFKNVKLI
ncbi:NACHT domain-containing protein [Rhizobium sp. CRIBSB]|nr:NACHT domain-containing protein [Rhizobium sp. CRIBSB]